MFIGCWNREQPLPENLLPEVNDNVSHTGRCQVFNKYNFLILFFGELYNRKELGYDSDANDAQIIYELYKESTIDNLHKLNGAFTCILSAPDLTIIFRDHHGISHQVYYNDICFASSLHLLQKTESSGFEPDPKNLSRFLSIGYIATPETAFKNVRKLGAGEIVSYRKGNLSYKKTYPTDNIQPGIIEKTLDEYAEEYGRLHEQAISRRLYNCNNAGLLLSGGYDSGCNLAALRKIYSGDIHTYSIGFKGDNWTELLLARIMSDTFETKHTEYEIDGSEIDALPQIVSHLGDPFVEGGLMVNHAVMQLVGNNKPDVLFGGDGSDQYFGTSGREVALHLLLSRYGMKPVADSLFKLLNSNAFEKNNKFYRMRFHLDKILHILSGDLFGLPGHMLKDMVQKSDYLPSIEKQHIDLRSFDHLYTQHAYKSDIEKIIDQVILFKASKMAEMFENKLTFPYLDLDLYNFLVELPVMYKCKGDNVKSIARGHLTAKYLLKYHYKPMLPEAITSKKKQGGFAPMPVFFKDDIRRRNVADYIMNSSVCQTYLKRDAVERFIRKYDKEVHEEGHWFWYKQNKAIQYFNLFTLALWWDTFVEKKSISF